MQAGRVDAERKTDAVRPFYYGVFVEKSWKENCDYEELFSVNWFSLINRRRRDNIWLAWKGKIVESIVF